MNVEAEFHKAIKRLVNKKHQGYVMGAFREIVQPEIEKLEHELRNAQHVLLNLTKA